MAGKSIRKGCFLTDMKILYLRTLYAIGLKAGGSVGHTAGVIHALAKLVTLKVVTNDELAEVKEPTRVIRPWVRKYAPVSIKEACCNIQFLFALSKEVGMFDGIYHRHAAYSFIGAFFSKKYHIPLILEFNSSEVWKAEHWTVKNVGIKKILKTIYQRVFESSFIRWVERYNLRHASMVVTVSEVLKDFLLESGVEERRILVNPNGVDIQKFSPHCGGDEIRARYGLTDKCVIGFIGTFGQWHGILELGKAIVKFRKDYPDLREHVRFLLVGDGVLMGEMKAVLHEGEAEDLVVLTGLVQQHEAPRYLDACDIYVSPHIKNPDGTRFFGSPTKLFEYMAMERGIVASRLDQIADILEHGKTAHLVEPGDVDAIAEGIHCLVEDDSYRKSLGTAARREAIEKYSWDAHVQRTLEAFRVIEKR